MGITGAEKLKRVFTTFHEMLFSILSTSGLGSSVLFTTLLTSSKSVYIFLLQCQKDDIKGEKWETITWTSPTREDIHWLRAFSPSYSRECNEILGFIIVLYNEWMILKSKKLVFYPRLRALLLNCCSFGLGVYRMNNLECWKANYYISSLLRIRRGIMVIT